MQMLCTRNDEVIVAVFFDIKTCVTTSTEHQGSVRDFLNQVQNAFCETYAGRVGCLRPTLKDCADGRVNVRSSYGPRQRSALPPLTVQRDGLHLPAVVNVRRIRS
ncbi:unnamed protein product [Scytosiphon promiscuus]